MARLFFAVWPDAAAAARLEALAREVALVTGGRPQPREKIHLTLAFLGEVAEERIGAACAAAPGGESLAIRLDCVGSFRRARSREAGPVLGWQLPSRERSAPDARDDTRRLTRQ